MMSEKKELLEGLLEKQKRISPKYFYDHKGSELFEKICEQEEYYVTQVELSILEKYSKKIVSHFDEKPAILEPGCGACKKIRPLLSEVNSKTVYIPSDISGDFLNVVAKDLKTDYPHLEISPFASNFHQDMSKYEEAFFSYPEHKNYLFFPGSTLGNFSPKERLAFLQSCAKLIKKNGLLMIGVDLIKDKKVLESAYNDKNGITEKFNKNMISHLSKKFDLSLSEKDFDHHAFYHEKLNRIEMHLRAKKELSFRLENRTIQLQKGETIHTENSYKFDPEQFIRDCAELNLELVEIFTDPKRYFGFFLFQTSL